MLKKPPAERLKLLRDSKNPQAQFLWAILRDSFHYAAVHLADIAESARDVDFAMRWGFGMKQGPFELWQAGRLAAGRAVGQGRHRRRQGAEQGAAAGLGVRRPGGGDAGVHTAEGSWSAAHAQLRAAPSTLPVYQRQPFPETVLGAGARRRRSKAGTEVFKNDEVRVWTLDGEVLIASITAKLHLISPEVIEGLLKAVELAEKSYQGLVIWSPDDVFSAGANLEALMPVFMKSGGKGIAARGEEAAGRDAAHALRQRAGGRGDARHGARRRLRDRGAFARGASRRWKATSAWSKSASA